MEYNRIEIIRTGNKVIRSEGDSYINTGIARVPDHVHQCTPYRNLSPKMGSGLRMIILILRSVQIGQGGQKREVVVVI